MNVQMIYPTLTNMCRAILLQYFIKYSENADKNIEVDFETQLDNAIDNPKDIKAFFS